MAHYKVRSAKLLDLLAERGLTGTITELAELAGISRNTASALINGKPVKMAVAIVVSDALGVVPSQLFEIQGGEE